MLSTASASKSLDRSSNSIDKRLTRFLVIQRKQENKGAK